MNRVLLNTLYVLQGGGYVKLDHETVVIEQDKTRVGKIPLLHLGAIMVRDDVMVSPGLLRACSERGMAFCWLDRRGRFIGALRGPATGNVLLRLAQHDTYRDRAAQVELARCVVAGKVKNARNTLVRRAREASGQERAIIDKQRASVDALVYSIHKAEGLDELRGLEGMAARLYFGAFNAIVAGTGFDFEGRSRRPPRDPFNAVLSFLYTLLSADCAAALEGVGLDPQVGFLHEVRPGRPSCALDLAEEFRSALVDRLVFALINRRQIHPERDFEARPGGAVYLNERGRKTVLAEYQKRKQNPIRHALFEEPMAFGLVPHVQARLLARTLRRDTPTYMPFEYT